MIMGSLNKGVFVLRVDASCATIVCGLCVHIRRCFYDINSSLIFSFAGRSCAEHVL